MKNLLLLLLSTPSFFLAQNFTWMRGSNTTGQTGIYGTPGVSSPTIDPGSRHGSGTWTDLNGDLWMFGGEGYDNSPSVAWLNDLWKYSVSSNAWTWMGGAAIANQPSVYGAIGVAAAANQPGAREFPVCWVDNAGKFWMLGGFGFGSSPTQTFPQRMGDLWKYDPLTNLWTWMNGFNSNLQNGIYGTLQTPSASNRPGCRMGSASWTDLNGNLWLFGGRGFPATGPSEGFLNDLWQYNVITNQWTWMGGSNQASLSGVFGTLGVPSASNMPGGKEFPASWSDQQGNLYLFGGRAQGYFNDLWRYSPINGTWTWLKGANTSNQVGLYGTMGVSSAANGPGGRFSQACWTDKYGQFWLFGGQGRSSYTTSVNNLNDLWKYDPCSNNWTWMKGSDTLNRLGTYGTQGIGAAANVPGSRFYNNSFRSKDGSKLWLIGGEGFDGSNFAVDHLNDVWRYSVATPADTAYSLSGPSLCSGKQASLNVAGSIGLNWYSSPTNTNVLFTGTPYVTPQLSAIGASSLYTVYAQVACNLRPRTLAQVTIHPLPVITITNNALTCAGNFTLSAMGAASYTWINGSNSATATFTNTSPAFTAYVLGSSTQGCESSASKTLQLSPAPVISISAASTVVCIKESMTLSSSGAATYTWANGATSSTVSASYPSSGSVVTSVVGTGTNGCSASASIALMVEACTGIANESTQHGIQLQPNPTQNKFNVRSGLRGEKTIFLHTVIGQLVFEKKFYEQDLLVDEYLVEGLYLITITNGKNLETARLLVNP